MIPTERHRPFLVPRDEVSRRVAALQAELQAIGVAVAWIEHLADRLYFSGSAQDGILLVPSDEAPSFLVRKSVARARAEASVDVEPYPGARTLLDRVGHAVGEVGRAGLALDVTPASTYARLVRCLEPGRIVDLAGIVRTVRSVKSSWEIEQIRRASDQVTTLYAEIGTQIRPGMTELDLNGRVEARLRELGHGGTVRVRRPGSDITMGVVVSGASALYPTSFAGCVGAEGPYPNTPSGGGWKTLAEGETVMLDIVTFHNGYHADTTRSFSIGRSVNQEALEAHDFCREILREIEIRMRPGAICSSIYREVRELAEKRGAPPGFMGFGENRIRFFGHGVGLELDEMPVLAEKIDVKLEPGMVLAVEPKAFLEGIGPVGVENTYVVTPNGCEPFSDADESLRPVGLSG